MSLPFPEPAIAVPSRAEVFLGYLDYFRSRLVSKLEALPGGELRASRLPSGWTPVELLKHLAYDELRWLEWRFEGRDIADPWGDDRDGRWYVAPGETLTDLVAALHAQAARTRAIVESHDLADRGLPGSLPRGDVDQPKKRRTGRRRCLSFLRAAPRDTAAAPDYLPRIARRARRAARLDGLV
jgi:hypothetical protein